MHGTFTDEIQEAVTDWVVAMETRPNSIVEEKKDALLALVRQEYDDPTIRQRVFDRIVKLVVERLDHEQE